MLKLKQILFISLLAGLTLSGASSAKVYDYTEDNQLTLLQNARDAVDLKLDLVRKAKSHIHIMTYYWDKKGYPMELITELKKAHDRGVDVRIMTTYIPSLTMDFFGKSKKALYAGEKNSDSGAALAYLKLVPGNNESLTNNIHEKIFLVDGEVAILGGRNISDNDFRAKDLEIKLEGPVVNEVQEHFQKMFSFLLEFKKKSSCDETKKDGCVAALDKLNFALQDKKFFPDQPHFENGARARILTNETLFQQNLHNYVGNARFNIKDDIIDTVIKTDFTTLRGYNYFIIPTIRYKNYLENNLAEGKKIEIITNSKTTAAAISDKGYLFGLPEMKNLVGQGLQLHQWLGGVKVGVDELFYLHEKVMLFDDDHAMIGSHNYGMGSTSVSSEIVVEFYSKPIVQTLINVFENEFNNEQITKNATLPMINQEIRENQRMVRFLHAGVIKNILSELY